MNEKAVHFLVFMKTSLMNSKKAFVYCALLLLIVLNAVAQEDFDITASADIDLCPCSNQGYAVYVHNKGASTTTYSVVGFSGDAAKWVKASPSKFSINPGATSYFFVYVSSDCGIEGAYGLNVFVKSASGLTKAVKQTLNFVECYRFDVEEGDFVNVGEGQTTAFFSKHSGAYSLCEKDKALLPVLITNREDYGNSYIMSLKGADFAKLNADEAKLDGNQKGIALINLSPGEGSAGNYKLKLDVATKVGNVKKTKEIDVGVEKCYGLDIDIEKKEDVVCGKAIYDVKIENEGMLSEEVNLSTNFEWADTEEKLTLGGNESAVSTLTLKPEGISGIFEVEVKGSVVGQDIEASDKIKVNAVPEEECYRAEIDIDKSITNKYTEEYYGIGIVNKGLKKAFYNVSLEGPEWATISPTMLQLNPGQRGSLNLYVNASDATAGIYNLVLKLEAEGNTYSEKINIKLVEESKIVKNIKWFINYFQFYIYICIAIAILLFVFVKPIKRQISRVRKSLKEYKLKKEKEKKLGQEKGAEKKTKFIESVYFKVFSAIAVLLMLAIAYYYFYNYVRDFFVLYLHFIIAGVAILFLIILLMRFYKPLRKLVVGRKK
jgi:hypothetical protein